VKNLQLRPDAVVANDIEHTGNTSAASIPLAMAELLTTGAAGGGGGAGGSLFGSPGTTGPHG
uniref:3-oxoacyl-[acyl-carrier-protein] synthase III C-terminal domain-containing protein n=1 Tax=Mycobacterium tuberculosis TaxID=1773 RepID=UPI000B053783